MNVKVGDIVKRGGSPVTIKAILPNNRYVVQFKSDMSSSTASTRRRHYEYHRDELEFPAKEIKLEYEIRVFDDCMELLDVVILKEFPTTDVLLKEINKWIDGRYAQVERRYVAE